MDTSKLSTGELIAGASGLALIVVLFLPWYGVDVNIAGFAASGNASAWEAFSFIDILLFLVGLVAIAVPVARAADALPEDIPGSVVLLAAGVVGLVLVLYRVIDVPGTDVNTVGGDSVDFGRKIGVFLGLIATAGITYGGWRANNEAHAPAPAAPPAPSA
jgi:hypothetical protein